MRVVQESGTSRARRCTRGVARDYTVLHEIAEWYTNSSGARVGVVHDMGARVRVVHEMGDAQDGCTRVEVHEMGA